jgi:hypothetical protein
MLTNYTSSACVEQVAKRISTDDHNSAIVLLRSDQINCASAYSLNDEKLIKKYSFHKSLDYRGYYAYRYVFVIFFFVTNGFIFSRSTMTVGASDNTFVITHSTVSR